MTKRTFLSIFGVLALLTLVTTGIFLYAQGYRLDFKKRIFSTTGVILAKSLPEGALVSLDGEQETFTNSSIVSVTPGTHHLKIVKDRAFPWENQIEVEAGLVTNITVLLPPLSPSLNSVTQDGARLVTRAPSGTKAAFLSKKSLFLLPLNDQFFGFLQTSPQEIGQEPEGFSFSQVTKIIFSPNENQILLLAPTKSLLFQIGQTVPQTIFDHSLTLKNWKAQVLAQKAQTVESLKVSEDLKDQALSPFSIWSPDERKILYSKKEGPRLTWWVVNFGNPLPVGEKENQKILETGSKNLKLFWLADSRHFVMVDGKTVSLLDLDGTNKMDLFNGKIVEPVALSNSDLSKVIILTKLSSSAQANLYAISLR